MGEIRQAAGGGLSAADKAKLIPANIREDVTLFAGSEKKMTGLCGEIVYAGILSVSVIYNGSWNTKTWTYIGSRASGDTSYMSATNGGSYGALNPAALVFTALKDFDGTAVVEYSGIQADSEQDTGLTFGGTAGLARGTNKNAHIKQGQTITLSVARNGWSGTGALYVTLIR